MKIFQYSLILCLLATAPAQENAGKPALTKETFQIAGEKLLGKLEEFSTVLDTAKDTATAEAAKIKLAKINKEIEALTKAAADLGEPPPAIKTALDNDPKMQDRAQSFLNKLITSSRRVAANPDLLAVLQPTMKDFQRVSQPAKKPEPVSPK